MKGISNVIASAMLIAIAISVAGVYSEWLPNFSENATQEVVDQTNNDIKCRNAGINIKDAEYSVSASLTSFDLDNTGTINLFQNITLVSITSSTVTDRETISELSVGEERRVELNTTRKPDKIIASSQDCPSLKADETDIKTT